MKRIKQAATRDMTVGSPLRLIVGFALPLMVGTLFQQLYSMVDTMIVGKILGADALAGVGSTGSISFMIIGFCNGVCSGFAIPVAQQFGAKNEQRLRWYVSNSAWLSIVFSLTMAAATVGLTGQILIWTNTPEDIFQYAYRYIVIIFAGIPAVYLYNLTAGIIRALGDSKTPLYFLIMSSVLNIILDLFCILVLRMGVSGAAAATVVSQAVSGGCCLIYMKRKYPVLNLKREDWAVRKTYLGTLCSMGVPMGLQYSVTAIGSVVLQTAVNGLGSVAVAAVTVAQKINLLFVCPIDALGVTMGTYSGQNVGGGKIDRLSKGLAAAGVIGAVYSVAAFLILLTAGEKLAVLFVEADETVIIRQAGRFLASCSMFYVAVTFVNTVRFSIQGMGFVSFSIFSGVFEMIARTIVGFVLVPRFGFTAVCFAHPAAWVAADLFLIPAFFRCKRVLERKLGQQAGG